MSPRLNSPHSTSFVSKGRSPPFDTEVKWKVDDSKIIIKVGSLHSTFTAVNILLGPIKAFKFGSK